MASSQKLGETSEVFRKHNAFQGVFGDFGSLVPQNIEMIPLTAGETIERIMADMD